MSEGGGHETGLWCAVIEQARADLFVKIGEASKRWLQPHIQAKREARAFFFAHRGDWPRAFHDVCGAAGFDPGMVRRVVAHEYKAHLCEKAHHRRQET